MQKICFVFFIVLNVNFLDVSAQVIENKISKMKSTLSEIQSTSVKKPVKKGIGNFLLNIYQKHLSVLISADCLYSLSCSRYSREVVNSKGLFLGVLLSADRLTRCSGFCAKDIPYHKYNNEGLVEDNP